MSILFLGFNVLFCDVHRSIWKRGSHSTQNGRLKNVPIKLPKVVRLQQKSSLDPEYCLSVITDHVDSALPGAVDPGS